MKDVTQNIRIKVMIKERSKMEICIRNAFQDKRLGINCNIYQIEFSLCFF
jgi:hypothetical protein